MDKYGVRRRTRLRSKVVGATFDDTTHLWRLDLEDGVAVTARFVVGATGVLTQPKAPEIKGIASFEGTVMHTARWDHDVDLTGKRVGIIGTGASAVQVIPSIAPLVQQLTVFQRTPIWCLPSSTPRFPERPGSRCADCLVRCRPRGWRARRWWS